MIQRIQTLYLLLASVLMALLLYFDVAIWNNMEGSSFSQSAMGIHSASDDVLHPNFVTIILVGLSSILNLVAIFCYRNRVLQMRLSTFAALLMIASVLLLIFYAYQFIGGFDMYRPTIFLLFPVVAIILNILAYKSIAIDERLVRSLDRLR